MADLASLLDSARLLLGDWLKIFTANLEYLSLSAVLVLVFFAWLGPPLRRRFWIRIDGRYPSAQSYLPEEVNAYIDLVNRASNKAITFWTVFTVGICESFAVVLSLGAFQQGIVLRDSSTATYTGFLAIVPYTALVTAPLALAVRFFTCVIWELVEGKRNRWNEIREMCRETGCGYYKGRDDWKGWAGWALEDKVWLTKRNVFLKQHIEYVESKDERTEKDEELLAKRNKKSWKLLEENQLEMSFWEILVEDRVPHIYQLGIQIGHGHYRYLDFALLDPKTGEPVLGIETDESDHLLGTKPQEDFSRELNILNTIGIPIHRIPGAYWLRGLEPNDLKHPEWFHKAVGPNNMKYPEHVKENQQRLLNEALQRRDHVIRAKQKQARLRFLLGLMRHSL